MPLFQRKNDTLDMVKPRKFASEKELQSLVESNLEEMFSCRFIDTEYSTGQVHAGRIDTLAISEDNNPVIIEYKVVESSQLVNQSLFYLSWLKDHKGDFELAVQKAFPDEKVDIDWSNIRVLCLAPEYKKYDLHAVQMMGANIELWQYRYYENGALFIEEVYKKSLTISSEGDVSGKNPVMVAAGKKAALTRATAEYEVDTHIAKLDTAKQPLLETLRDYILHLDESVEEVPKKYYIAYKVSKNFVCMEVHKSRILLYLKVDPSSIDSLPPNTRDVRKIGHFGTGDLEFSVKNGEEAEAAKEFISMAFENIGGN